MRCVNIAYGLTVFRGGHSYWAIGLWYISATFGRLAASSMMWDFKPKS